jgi:hypothetical protein
MKTPESLIAVQILMASDYTFYFSTQTYLSILKTQEDEAYGR